MKELIKKLTGAQKFIDYLRMEFEGVKLLQAKGIVHQMKEGYQNVQDFSEIEFSVFSQIGDDGIIQYLIHTIEIENKFFIEFGVQNYIESNTRFLLINDNWTGVIYDGSKANIDFIQNDYYYWKYNLKARNLFITAENINEAFLADGVPKEPGILHIDIDGNDYWIWKAIQVINPVIVIMEYNSGFGNERTITVPYHASFERYNAHFSGLYFGASLGAVCMLAKEKGYSFIGSNSYGNNAYFVRNDKLGKLTPVDLKQGYRESFARQNKDENGNFTYKTDSEVLMSLKHLSVYNTQTNKTESLNSI